MWQWSTRTCPLSVHRHGTSTHIIAGHVTGLGTSVSRSRSYALVTLRCWRHIYTVLDDRTPPPVHTVMEPIKQQNIWSYTVWYMTRLGRSRGPTSTTKAIQDACRASWRGSGWWPIPPAGNERERPRPWTESRDGKNHHSWGSVLLRFYQTSYNNNNHNNLYGTVILPQALQEFNQFMQWMQKQRQWLPTFGPSQSTWARSPPIGCQ